MRIGIRKIISSILAAATLFSVLSVCAQATQYTHYDDETFKLGDANRDGKVNGTDSFYMKCCISGKDGNIDRQAADLSADGRINGSDIFYLKKILSGSTAPEELDTDYQVYKFTVAGNDISDYEIVVCGGTEEDNVYTAASLLAQYVEEVVGVKLSIVFDSSEAEHTICFNRLDPLGEDAVALGLGNEGYLIDVENGNMIITGTLRGCMYAAYELIEDYLGVRFIDNDYLFLYKTRYSEIPEGTHVRKDVRLEFRYCGIMSKSAMWGAYYGNRLNGSQLYCGGNRSDGYQTGPHFINAHSFGYYWQMGTGTMPGEDFGTLSERYAAKFQSGEAKDPKKWQPCGSDENAYRIMYTGLIDVIEMITSWGFHHFVPQYGCDSMSFSINDNGEYCSCILCHRFANGLKDKKTGQYIKEPEGYGGLYMNLANRAARDIQDYMPGLKIFMILYDHTVPATVRPDKNLILMYCGHGCNNHVFGSGECGDSMTSLGTNNNDDEIMLKRWVEIAHDSGASVWFWSYAVSYGFYLGGGCPNIPELYAEMKYIVDECGADGFYYEGDGSENNFEKLKGYISTKLMWEPDMTYDEFVGYVKEYLYMYYGKGYEQLWQYILMQTEAGDRMPCFINNFDRPGDMMEYAYLAEHYEEMHGLLWEAYYLATSDLQRDHVKKLMLACEFMGLTSVYDDWYVNGDGESRALYEDRYTWFYNYLVESGAPIGSDDVYTIPETIDFTVNPMIQFYEFGSRKPWITP